jgi:hypothetical protein
MSWLSEFFGMDAADQAGDLQDEMLNLIRAYGTPALQAQLQSITGMQPSVTSAQGTLSSLMANPSTFATPDWQNPFTPQEISTMQQLGAMDVNNMTNKLGDVQRSDLNQRGISNSSAGNALAPNLELYRQSELAKNNADILSKSLARSDQLRSEGKTTAGNLWNMANYSVPGGTVGSYTSTLASLIESLQKEAASQGTTAGGLLGILLGKIKQQ